MLRTALLIMAQMYVVPVCLSFDLGSLLPTPSQPKETLKLNCALEQIPSALTENAQACEMLLKSFSDLLLKGPTTNKEVEGARRNVANFRADNNPEIVGSASTANKSIAIDSVPLRSAPDHRVKRQASRALIPGKGESANESEKRFRVCDILLEISEVRQKCCQRIAESCPENTLPPGSNGRPTDGGNSGGGSPTPGGLPINGLPNDWSSLVNQAMAAFSNLFNNKSTQKS